ncbi:MAG TPA: stage III sporulation protein AE, partial [Symbiobacteriaceae bacterium]|nr:stage III sporulation protein AE [Symbiobacteriaceae bacterium]
MVKRVVMVAAVLLFLLGGPVLAEGPPGQQQLLQQQSQNLDTREVEEFLRSVNQTWEGYGPDISLKDFLEVYKGGEDAKYSPKAIFSGLVRYLLREVVANTGLLTKIILLAVVAAVLQNMQSAFDSEATGKLAQWVVYLMLAGLAITGFSLAVTTARQVMDTLSGFMLAILPTLLAVLVAMGGITSAAIFHPLMVTLTSTAANLMVAVVFPLIFLSAVLEIVSGLNENFKLTSLAGLFRQGAMWSLGLMSTIFLGTVAVKGVAGAVADGVTMKTAKFVFSNFIPVVGKMFSDATELIFGSTILLKNALGMVGAAAIFFITAFPLLKILSLVLVYQIAGALVQPVGAGPMAKMLTTMAKALQMVFASV